MRDFADTSFTSGSFPSVIATDASGPYEEDGTPLVAAWVSDIWLAMQQVLNEAGYTPDGASEDSSSQFYLGLRYSCGTPGEIVFSALPERGRVISLAGQRILVADYPLLVEATWVEANNATASAFYKCDVGGARNASGLYLQLPDARGLFIRAIGDTAGTYDVDRESSGEDEDAGSFQSFQAGLTPCAVGATIGSSIYPIDALGVHVFNESVIADASGGGSATSVSKTIPIVDIDGPVIGPGNYGDIVAANELQPAFGGTSSDTETRVRNLGFWCGIRY